MSSIKVVDFWLERELYLYFSVFDGRLSFSGFRLQFFFWVSKRQVAFALFSFGGLQLFGELKLLTDCGWWLH